MNSNITINNLILESFSNAREHGFWNDGFKYEDIGLKLMLIVSEVSEAFEEWRANKPINYTYFRDDGKPEGIPSELADVMIRIADLAGAFEIDLEAAILEKVKYNKSRPYKHGKIA